jgi:hydrogenase nickel incorporation protein HypA/HybF
MHEMSLTQSLLAIIEEHAVRYVFSRVNSIRLSFGRLACIEPKALAFAFEVLAQGTRAEGARIDFDIRPICIYCMNCGKDIELLSYEAQCPQCLGQEVMLVGGTEELKLVEMEVD